MKGELRQSYRTIANIGNMGLCNFCKYASWSGYCSDAELECENGIEAIEENAFEVWTGSDCWAFRTKYDLQTCATIASIMHDGNVPHLGRGNEWIAIVPNAKDREQYDL